LGELISKSNALDFKDIKFPLTHILDYYQDNKGDGAGLSVTRDILKRREERKSNTTKKIPHNKDWT
jgi:hypothetical protein